VAPESKSGPKAKARRGRAGLASASKNARRAILTIKAAPRSSSDRLLGRSGETVRIALAAPPVDGEANERLLRFLAKILDLRLSDLSLLHGSSSRTKTVTVKGLDDKELEARLDALMPSSEGPGASAAENDLSDGSESSNGFDAATSAEEPIERRKDFKLPKGRAGR
jgi:uncharacterized protein (TIGR00251 family)